VSRSRRGLTLSELLTVVAIVVVAVLMLPAFLLRPSDGRESSRRIICSSNLYAIAVAMHIYAEENDGALNRVAPFADGPDSGKWLRAGARTEDGRNPMGRVAQGATEEEVRSNALDAMFNPKSAQPCAVGGSPTASLLILVRNGFLDAKKLLCPSDRFGEVDELQEAKVEAMVDLAAPTNCSYSLSAPWGRNVDWTINGHPRSVLMADLSPVGVSSDAQVQTSGEDGNSRTHRRAGQNVLYRDGSSGWESSNLCGIGGDNIFTVSTGPRGPGKAPTLTDAGGTCLPRDTNGSAMIFYGRESHPRPRGFGAHGLLRIVSIAVIFGLVACVWLARRRSRAQGNEIED